MIAQLIASPTVKAAMEQFVTSAAKLLERPSAEDRRYEAIRTRARTLLDEYRKDPLNIDLAAECDRLVRELEGLDLKEMIEFNRDRSRANIVFISAQTKRTHYAAYMAGCLSSNQHVGDAFKAWMHNAAADGAISLYEAIRAVTQRHRSESQESELLRVFGNGAFLDARRFLTRAAEYYPECVLTGYNEAKVLILAGATTGDRRKIAAGINQLKGIVPPANDCHSAELVWHGNIYETYAQEETHLREIIGSFKEDEVPRLEQVFQTNATIAKKILDERGDAAWLNTSRITKVIVTGAFCGLAVLSVIALNYENIEHLSTVATHQGDLFYALVQHGPLGLVGGGLAHVNASLTSLYSVGGGL
jgi:hypothetical protein